MPQFLVTPLLSILGALIVAGIVGWIRRPRLAYLVPRLFTKSNISDEGQLAEITVLNRGFGNEEDVVLTLNPKLSYEIVGSTSRDYVFSDTKLTIPRIGSNKDITVVLTIEGGAFGLADIESCLSKSTTGQGVNSLAEVPSSGQSKVAGVVTFIFIPLAFFSVFWGIDKIFETPEGAADAAKDAAVSASAAADSASKAAAELQEVIADVPKVFHDWKIAPTYYMPKKQVFSDFESGALSLTIGDPVRSGSSDIVAVPILFKNLSDTAVKYTVDLTTAASENDERVPSYERRLSDIFVAPNSVSTKKVKVVVPAKSIDPSQRTLWVEAFIISTEGDSLRMTQIVQLRGS